MGSASLLLLSFLRWVGGSLLLVVGGVSLAKVSAVSGLSFLAAGLLILPPTFPLLARTTGFAPARPAKFLVPLLGILAGFTALVTTLDSSPNDTPQARAALRLAQHTEDSLAVAEGLVAGPAAASAARPIPRRYYSPGHYGRSRRGSRRYYPGRYYQAPAEYRQETAPAATPAPPPRTYTYRSGAYVGGSRSPAAGSSTPAASQPYRAPRVYSYRPGRQPAAAPPSWPQSYKPTRFSWKRSSK